MRITNTTKLSGNRVLYAWWANNAGRGRNNCTLIVTDADNPRATRSGNQTGIISKTQTSSWAFGDVNLSERVLDELGLVKSDLLKK